MRDAGLSESGFLGGNFFTDGAGASFREVLNYHLISASPLSGLNFWFADGRVQISPQLRVSIDRLELAPQTRIHDRQRRCCNAAPARCFIPSRASSSAPLFCPSACGWSVAWACITRRRPGSNYRRALAIPACCGSSAPPISWAASCRWVAACASRPGLL